MLFVNRRARTSNERKSSHGMFQPRCEGLEAKILMTIDLGLFNPPPGDPWYDPESPQARPTRTNAGDALVLWGIGFGPTNPPMLAGAAVTGTPTVNGSVTGTVGGALVNVLYAVRSPDATA